MQWHFQAHIKSEAEKVPQCWLSVSLVDGSTMLAYSHTPQGSLITLMLYIPRIRAVGRGNSLCLVLFKHAFLFKGSDVVLLFISSCGLEKVRLVVTWLLWEWAGVHPKSSTLVECSEDVVCHEKIEVLDSAFCGWVVQTEIQINKHIFSDRQ